MEKIIDNGLGSIRVGLEDFKQGRESDDDARLTSAVRNVFAGILILAKGKLYTESPKDSQGILIRNVQTIIVDGRFVVEPRGKNTIGYEEIKSRFEQLRIKFDWSEVDRVRAIRNDLEHFYHDGSRSKVREALADAATATRNLLILLELDPVRDLGEEWWNIMLGNQKLYSNELAVCRNTFSNINWINLTAEAASDHFSCKQCGSSLIRQSDASNKEMADIYADCGACGSEFEMKELMEHSVRQQHYSELFEFQSQGGDPPVVRCPNCQDYSLVMNANECAACGNKLEHEATWCDDCYNPISVEEQRTASHRCPPYFHD